MDAYSLQTLVSQRVPGFSNLDYLRELNAAYAEVWGEVLTVFDLYFTDTETVTVTSSGGASILDFQWNANSNLSASVSPLIHKLTKIRVKTEQTFIPADARDPNDPLFLAHSQRGISASSDPPFYYYLQGRSLAIFAVPLPQDATVEVTYQYGYVPLVIQASGTITTSGSSTSVTGTNTNFMALVDPDYQGTAVINNPTANQIGARIYIQSQPYAVQGISSATALTTRTIPAAVSGQAYMLASEPVLPSSYHQVIADVATRNLLSVPSEDAGRFAQWAAICQQRIDTMKQDLSGRSIKIAGQTPIVQPGAAQ